MNSFTERDDLILAGSMFDEPADDVRAVSRTFNPPVCGCLAFVDYRFSTKEGGGGSDCAPLC